MFQLYPGQAVLVSALNNLESSNRGGFAAGTTSCKRHEMSSKKLCGEGWVRVRARVRVRVRANKSLL